MKRYSTQFKTQVLTALDANGGDTNYTAKLFNVPRRTLVDWIKMRQPDLNESPENQQFKNLTTSEQLDLLAKQLLAALPAKIKRAGLGETLRAISALDELRKAIAAHEPASDIRTELADHLQTLHEKWEADIIERGGHAQLEALKKAQADLDTFLSAPEEYDW